MESRVCRPGLGVWLGLQSVSWLWFLFGRCPGLLWGALSLGSQVREDVHLSLTVSRLLCLALSNPAF